MEVGVHRQMGLCDNVKTDVQTDDALMKVDSYSLALVTAGVV